MVHLNYFAKTFQEKKSLAPEIFILLNEGWCGEKACKLRVKLMVKLAREPGPDGP